MQPLVTGSRAVVCGQQSHCCQHAINLAWPSAMVLSQVQVARQSPRSQTCGTGGCLHVAGRMPWLELHRSPVRWAAQPAASRCRAAAPGCLQGRSGLPVEDAEHAVGVFVCCARRSTGQHQVICVSCTAWLHSYLWLHRLCNRPAGGPASRPSWAAGARAPPPQRCRSQWTSSSATYSREVRKRCFV